MRTVKFEDIKEAVAKLCIQSNCILNDDINNCFDEYLKAEESEVAVDILKNLKKNAETAEKKMMPICQDTGMAVVFVEIGQEVYIEGGLLTDAVNEGVRKGYVEGYLRKSVVYDPIIKRINTKDNTPAIIHYNIVKGDRLKITVAPKGFGSENMSRIYMLKPSDGREGVIDCVLKTIKEAGSNPCPPMIVGIGLGGNFEYSAYLAKKALLRPVGINSEKEYLKEIEKEVLDKANKTGIGPQGLGGRTTILWAAAEDYPTHIAGMPVAVNISCHVTRHGEVIL
ncbi:MAG: fumarate hydratase [Clostridiales bacterium]|nr:fumarate hydratase [Clostridiales bacterium]